jgi:cell division protein FtsX
MQGSMLTLGCAASALTAIAAFADHRRRNRADLDRVGFMPWPLISVMAVMTALVAFALAIKGG